MTKRKQTSGRQVLAALALGLAIYLMMVLGPLAWMAEIAGQPVFDLRPMGYSTAEAAALLAALGEAGQAIYLWRQIPLDLIYPALMAMVFWRLAGWISAGAHARGRESHGLLQVTRFARACALCAGAADYAENLLVVTLLIEVAPQEQLVPWASAATIAKSVLTTVTVLLLALAGGLVLLRRRGVTMEK